MADLHGSPTIELWVNVGCHVLPNSSGHSETVAISWDRVLFLWAMSIWSVHISGQCSFLVGTCPYAKFYQDSTHAIQLGIGLSWYFSLLMGTWLSWYFSLLNILFNHLQYIYKLWLCEVVKTKLSQLDLSNHSMLMTFVILYRNFIIEILLNLRYLLLEES